MSVRISAYKESWKFPLRSARLCYVLCLKTESNLPLGLAPQANTCDHSVQKFRCPSSYIYFSLCTKAQNASVFFVFFCLRSHSFPKHSPSVLKFIWVTPNYCLCFFSLQLSSLKCDLWQCEKLHHHFTETLKQQYGK